MTAEQEERFIADNMTGGEADHSPVVEHSDTSKSGFTLRSLLPLLLLTVVLAIAGYFRFTGLDWDDTYHLHPDERFLTDVATRLQLTDPLTYLKTSESPLNPYNVDRTFYVYGNFPMTMTRFVAEGRELACEKITDLCDRSLLYYDGIHLIGRFLSALLDMVSILFTFLIGRRLYDWRAGIIGALLLAAAVMPIQQSHFFTMDNWAAALSVITMYSAVRAGEDESNFRWWLLFGLFLGLTVASRINMAPLAIMAVVAGAVWLIRRIRMSETPSAWHYLQSSQGSADLWHIFLGLILAAVISLLVFRIAQPYSFADGKIVQEIAREETGQIPGTLETFLRSIYTFNPQWRANMTEIQNLQSPEASFPPALQWTNRLPIIFPYLNIVLWGMGLAAGVAATFGFLWAIRRILNTRPGWTSHLFLLSWVSFYFLFMSTRWVKSIRYFLPIYPFLCLVVGWVLVQLWNKARDNRGLRFGAAVAGLLVIVPTILWAYAFLDIYRQPVTRVQASEWIFQNVPSGATLLYEVDGESRQLQLPLRGFELSSDGVPLYISFTMPETGLVSGIRFNYLSVLNGDDEEGSRESMLVSLLDGTNSQLSESVLALQLGVSEQQAEARFPDIELPGEQTYTLYVEAIEGSPIRFGTSVIANEHWDDSLPVRYNGLDPFGFYYQGAGDGQIQITHPDSEEKRSNLYQWLEQSDYIVLSSQRALWSLPRLPLTFPMTIRYYEGLFNGELGFDLVAQFHAVPNIGPLHISDVAGKVNWGEPPEIGWPPPGMAAAEEAFSVYDHPPVWIFAKSERYDTNSVRQILDAVDLSDVIAMNPGQATRAPNGLLLDAESLTTQQANGTFSKLFSPDSLMAEYPWLAGLVWWLSIVILGWITFPIVFVVFRGLPDRGYPIARILSLLLISYFTWLMASLKLLPNTRSSAALGLVLVTLVSLLIFLVRKRDLVTFVRRNLQYLGMIELLALIIFLFFVLIRLGNPDVWDVIWGGEKPMDLSYLNAILKSTTFPPYDPWFAGGYINYYYYGFVYVSSLIQLLGIRPTIAYNLILPMLASFTALGAFSAAFNLITIRDTLEAIRERLNTEKLASRLRIVVSRKAVIGGMVAITLMLILGNLAEIGVVTRAWYQSGELANKTGSTLVNAIAQTADGALDLAFTDETAQIYPGDWFWSATRIINTEPGEVQPITEFPFFTFLYGDLHAHMIAMPLALLAFAWILSMVLARAREQDGAPGPRAIWQRVLMWLVGALVIGVLWATNSWDYPTYIVLAVIGLFYGAYLQHGRWSAKVFSRGFVTSALLVSLSFILFLPFTLNYGRAYSSFSLWPGSYTQMGSYLLVHGLFLFLAITHLAIEFRAWSRSWTVDDLAKWEPYAIPVLLALMILVLILFVALFKGYWITPLVLLLSMLSGILAIRPGLAISRRIPLVLISAALALTLFVEYVVLAGDIGRMNTVFKFYMQVWVLLSVSSGVTIIWDWASIESRHRLKRIWQVVLVALVVLAALYPLLATKAKWDSRMSDQAPITLDGMEFMRTTTYMDTAVDGSSRLIDLSQDYEAIKWIQRHIEGSPVIVEAHSSNPYRSIANRVSMYTGLPTIVGWDWHQRQQRASIPGSVVTNRIFDVNTLYNTEDINIASSILAKYNVAYIYVGPLEWTYYTSVGLAKFERMEEAGLLQEVYRKNGVVIYSVDILAA